MRSNAHLFRRVERALDTMIAASMPRTAATESARMQTAADRFAERQVQPLRVALVGYAALAYRFVNEQHIADRDEQRARNRRA